ncbi:MAG: VWA domain-containing protein, partial [Candidatus Poribacteria bacterium]
MLRIINYWPFIFFILIPYLIYVSRNSLIDAAPWRKNLTLALRILALILMILALTDLKLRRQSEILSVVFAVDVSDSISASQREEVAQRIDDAVKNLKDSDEFSIITFAANASVAAWLGPARLQPKSGRPNLLGKFDTATPADRLSDFDQLLSDTDLLASSVSDTRYTNISSAIRLALSMFSQTSQKRIVLFSDGNQNVEDARDLANVAKANGVEIDVVPLSGQIGAEVLVDKLRMPSQVRVGEAFNLRMVIESTLKTPSTIQVYQNGQLMGEPKGYELAAGKQLLDDFPQRLDAEGTYEYKVVINAEKDTIKENNTAYGSVTVRGKPKVLYVGFNPNVSLQTALTRNSIAVTPIEPKQTPNTLTDLQSYDAIIFDDVPAESILADKLIESYVRDLGKGFIMIGGENSFGSGGYFDTPIERVLPVNMSPQKKQSLALMLLLDKSGSMANFSGGAQKMEIAVRAAKSVIETETLKEKDIIGVIAFDAQTQSRVVQIADVKDKEKLSDWVSTLRAGSGTNMYKALKQAHEQLKTLKAKQKHIIVLSDGKSEGDFLSLAKRIAADKITISTIAIGDADRELMAEIARVGKGRYRDVIDVSQLPKVLLKEVRQTQELIIEEDFQPRLVGAHEILTGIASVPKLRGYIATSAKQEAEVPIVSPEEHPILAAWRYGLGRSIAFTSDAKPRWAVEWIGWDKFSKFWTQAVNWVLPAPAEDYDVAVSATQGRASVTLETFKTEQNQVEFRGRVTNPDATVQILDLRQTAPNHYESLFDVNQTGAYLININKLRDGRTVSQQSASFVSSYSPEFATINPDIGLLKRLADDSNGIFNPTAKQIAHRSGAPTEIFESLWGLFALCAALLFLLELITRRLQLSKSQVAASIEKIPLFGRKLFARIPKEEAPGIEGLARLRQRKIAIFSTPHSLPSQSSRGEMKIETDAITQPLAGSKHTAKVAPEISASDASLT